MTKGTVRTCGLISGTPCLIELIDQTSIWWWLSSYVDVTPVRAWRDNCEDTPTYGSIRDPSLTAADWPLVTILSLLSHYVQSVQVLLITTDFLRVSYVTFSHPCTHARQGNIIKWSLYDKTTCTINNVVFSKIVNIFNMETSPASMAHNGRSAYPNLTKQKLTNS